LGAHPAACCNAWVCIQQRIMDGRPHPRQLHGPQVAQVQLRQRGRADGCIVVQDSLQALRL
jgi:hypothetical protein